MLCKGCDKNFLKENTYVRHLEKSVACSRVEDLIKENEKLRGENIVLKKMKKVEKLENIELHELNINKLEALDLIEYGTGIAKFIINKTNIIEKIILKEKKRRLLIYKIENTIYKNYGEELIYFLINNYKDKIKYYLENLYGNIREEDFLYNEHIKRMLNIKNIELLEILNKENINNNLGNEIILYLINYLKNNY